jgi:uncharacterized membrane protein YfcA
MNGIQYILIGCFLFVDVAVIVAWYRAVRSRALPWRPRASDILIGCGTCFLDTLGIGNYAQITALFKVRGHPADEFIPGTLNVGLGIPVFVGALLFVTSVAVDPKLLLCMVLSAGLGAWLGAGIVSRMNRRTIQLFMGVALLIAAGFFVMTNIGVLPPVGTATSLSGWRFAFAVSANFILGALMCAGIGNYAPSMALLAFLGMHPIAAYPIMIGSDGVLIPVAGIRFIKSGRFSSQAAFGLTVGGIVGALLAFPLVKTLAGHLSLMRWAVTGVITYAGITMLRSASRAAGDTRVDAPADALGSD